jgi:glutathione S-transferase
MEEAMTLQLYYTPVACSMVPYINLTEAQADFEVMPLNFSKGEHMSPEYLRLNPKHRVPVLMIDGEPLTENVAINLWIARTFPQAKLLPIDRKQEIKAISLMAWCASGIHPALTPNALPKRFCDAPDSEESVKQCAQKLLAEHFGIADALLAGREWFFDHYTAPDAYFFWTFLRALRFDGISTFQNSNIATRILIA